jgi:hypothetical protein
VYINNVKYQIDGGSYHFFLHIPTNGWLLFHHPSSLFLPIIQGLYVRRTEVEPIKDVMADNPINTAMTKPYDTMWSCSLLKLLILRCVSLLNQLAKKSRTWSTYVKKIWCSTCDDGRMTELGCLLPQIHPTKVPRPKTCDTWSIGARVEVQEPQLWDFGPGICQRFLRAKSWSSWWILNFFSYRIRHFFHATLILETTISGKILRWERTGQRIEKIQNDLRPTEHSCIQPTIGCRSLAQKKPSIPKQLRGILSQVTNQSCPNHWFPLIQKPILRVHNALQGLQGWTEHVFLPANTLFLFRNILCLMMLDDCYMLLPF